MHARTHTNVMETRAVESPLSALTPFSFSPGRLQRYRPLHSPAFGNDAATSAPAAYVSNLFSS